MIFINNSYCLIVCGDTDVGEVGSETGQTALTVCLPTQCLCLLIHTV